MSRDIDTRQESLTVINNVQYWMRSPVITVTPETQLTEALALMHEHSIRRLPVSDALGKLCGIITAGDIRGANVLRLIDVDIRDLVASLQRTQVLEVMTQEPIAITSESTIREAALLMLDNKIGGLPVVNERNEVVGIITESDLFEALVCVIDRCETE
jgi:acetoin utilization protein AcuB/CBS domain-containing protein